MQRSGYGLVLWRQEVVVVLAAVLLTGLSGCRKSSASPEVSNAANSALVDFSGNVVKISDGDTVQVMRDGRAVKIRLYGIDAPEKTQAFGQRAKQFTGEAVFGKVVTVKVHDTDRYGRTVAEIIEPDGKSLNEELVRAGLAWWYRNFAKKEQRFEVLEQEARAAKRGLWADAHPVPPWEFRHPRGNLSEESDEGPDGVRDAVGNKKSRLYRLRGCPGFAAVSGPNRVEFASAEEAEAQGYKRASNCK